MGTQNTKPGQTRKPKRAPKPTGRPPEVPYDIAKQIYLTEIPKPSYNELADRLGCSCSCLRARGSQEGWYKQRKAAQKRGKLKSIEKNANAIAKEMVGWDDKHLTAALSIYNQVKRQLDWAVRTKKPLPAWELNFYSLILARIMEVQRRVHKLDRKIEIEHTGHVVINVTECQEIRRRLINQLGARHVARDMGDN